MIADNWAICPQCQIIAVQRQAEEEQELAAAYGQVSSEEYLRLFEASRIKLVPQETLRESWDIGIWEGKFDVSYCATCLECGLTHKFEHAETIPSP